MALGKVLNLGGMDNSLPKTAQSNGRFRVARNVIPTPDGDIIPRAEVSEIAGQSNNFRYIHYQTQYDSSIISIVSEDTYSAGTPAYHSYLGNTKIPSHGFSLGISTMDFGDEDCSRATMSFRKNNTTYFVGQPYGYVWKYDGVEMSYAGCQQPWFSCAQYLAAGTKFIRVIQHSIDFDNNEPVSEYVQFPTSAATTISIRSDGGATNILDLVGTSANISPTQKVLARPDVMSPFFIGAATYNAGTQDYSITVIDTNILNTAQIGSYVIVNFQYTAAATTGLTEDCLGYALRIKSISPLKLDALNAKYLSMQREWKSGTIGNAGIAAAIAWGTRNVFTVWGSSSANGNYVFRGIGPSFPEASGVSYSFLVDVSTVNTALAGSNLTMFSISSNLGDWYDTLSRKLSPNAIYPYGLQGTSVFAGISQYQDQLIFWTDDLIWFSDPNLGGTFEQLTTSSFIRVGDTEFGNMMSLCGTQDFILISRERKNYFLNGTIPTGNYRIQEIPEAEVGAWSNNAIINVKDSAIMISALGVFQVLGGGRAVKLSQKIPKNFTRYNSAGINEDVVFSLVGTNINEFPTIDIGLSVAYDEYRELLVFMRKGPNFEGNPCLVLHTMTGEFYEWNGIRSDTDKYVTSIMFMNGKMTVADYTKASGTLGAKAWTEDSSLDLTYPESYPVQLFSTWLTAGEPSLEKEVLQIKIFGNITVNSPAAGINIVHFKDWDYLTRITNSKFIPVSATSYSNKKRLNSDKALAISCGLEIDSTGVQLRLESLEVEFNPIQQGMKR